MTIIIAITSGLVFSLFFVHFWSFQTNIAIFTTNICEKCPSSIRCRDSSPQPLEHGSLPITIRPGLPPNITSGLWGWFWNLIKKHKEERVGLGKAFQFLMESVLLKFLQVGLSRYSKCAINWLSVDFSQRPISWFRCSFETVIDYLSFLNGLNRPLFKFYFFYSIQWQL